MVVELWSRGAGSWDPHRSCWRPIWADHRSRLLIAERRVLPSPGLCEATDRVAICSVPEHALACARAHGQVRDDARATTAPTQTDSQRGRGEESDSPRFAISVLGPLRIDGKRPIRRAATTRCSPSSLHPAVALPVTSSSRRYGQERGPPTKGDALRAGSDDP